MKKNNWIVMCIALVASAFLLWLWFALHFDHVDAPLDLVLSIIWWAIIAGACYLIHRVEKKRQERLRTCYVAKSGVYNPESGARPIDGLDSAADCMRDIIKDLKYGFGIEDMPDGERYIAVVRSQTFDLKQEADEAAGTGEDLEWRGEVAVVSRPDDDPLPFGSKEELRQIMVRLSTAA